MKNKILSNLPYLLCGVLGLFTFIWFAIPYVAAFVDYGSMYSASEGISGYTIMDTWDGGFSGIMMSLFQILVLILAIVMLIYGILGLLFGFGILGNPPPVFNKKTGEFALFAYTALNVLLLIFIIIFCVSNTESEGEYSAGISISAGIFITLIFAIGALVSNKILGKMATDCATTSTFVCSACGKQAKKGQNFCASCGGAVVELTPVAQRSARYCSVCGKTATASENFCSACGGKIVDIAPADAQVEIPQEQPDPEN